MMRDQRKREITATPYRKKNRNPFMLLAVAAMLVMIVGCIGIISLLNRESKPVVGGTGDSGALNNASVGNLTVSGLPSGLPEELLSLCARNPEMTDFAMAWPQKKGTFDSNTPLALTDGEIPLLMQWDARWGYSNYGDGPFVLTGCGPTCLSMVAAGLTGDATLTPRKVADYAERNGYYSDGAGTNWTLMSEGAAQFGLLSQELPLMESAMIAALQDGQPIICSLGPGDFTREGHYIVLTGYQNGAFTVNDPVSTTRSNQTWTFQRLEGQIRNLWAFAPTYF